MIGMAAVAGAPDLAGRDGELAVARGLLAAARRAAGGLLLVTGGAGIGKTLLLAELSTLAGTDGWSVLAGQAIPGCGTYRALSAAVTGYLRQSPEARAADDLRPFRAADILSMRSPGAGFSWSATPRTGWHRSVGRA